ncbi:alpha/beta hydrolase fold domain-containing protein [Urechidicola sp. KH5]
MRKILLFSFLLVLFCIQTGMTQQKNGRPPVKEPNIPEGINYQVKHYREGNFQRASEIDIAFKDDGLKDKPVVVFIHGGGWTKGDNDQVSWLMFQATKQGFVGVSISYRLIQEAPFPACIEDVKQAIRYLKSLENEIPMDSDRIGVWGYSAGAHLALMIALTPDEAFKTDVYSNYTSNIKTVMAVSAPTDFVARVKNRGSLTQFSKYQNKDESFQKSVSPVTYIHKNQIPVYMLHGTEDPIVMPYHYKNFEKECQENRVSNFKLYEFEKAGHMFYFKQKEKVQPIFQEFLKSI